MRTFGKWLGRGLLALVAAVVLVLAFGPHEDVGLPVFDARALPADLDAYLAAEEAQVPGITPGTAKGIVWAGAAGVRTPVALVYLHGYSATRQELSPVAEQVAARLGANLYFARFAGHGLPGAALAQVTPADWVRDAGEALAIGRRLGETVVVIGTSTGATWAVLAAEAGAVADAYVFVSPNFRVKNPAARLLTLPFARIWVPWLVGPEREWTPQNAGHGRYWTTRYPSVALVPMAASVQAAREAGVWQIAAPVLAIFRDADEVVDETETRALLARWGGKVTIVNPAPVAGDDPENHVIAGAILSPGATPGVIDAMAGWIGGLQSARTPGGEGPDIPEGWGLAQRAGSRFDRAGAGGRAAPARCRPRLSAVVRARTRGRLHSGDRRGDLLGPTPVGRGGFRGAASRRRRASGDGSEAWQIPWS